MALVREARLTDAERLLEIYGYYVENTAVSFEYTTPSLEEFLDRMKGTMEWFPYVVVEEDGIVAGYAYAGPFAKRAAYSWCCELSIYIDKGSRGRGLGRALYAALEDKLRKMGYVNMYACIAWPETEDEYLTTDSADFHRHLGFSEAGRFRKCGYKFGRWYTMIWMEKTIGERFTRQPPVTCPDGLREDPLSPISRERGAFNET
ncbi:MAG: N-acetyltransferase [Oscillospiraceae bacterium]|nr:N-acetyltransferase [Oscillospiraceae bacterium]